MTLKTKIAIAAGILLAFIAAGTTIYIQHKNNLLIQKDLKAAKEKETEYLKTIEGLKAEMAKKEKTCNNRIATKDNTIERLRQIDEMTPGPPASGQASSETGGKEGSHEENHSVDDPIHAALNGMFGGKK